jgi:transmembrane sensor
LCIAIRLLHIKLFDQLPDPAIAMTEFRYPDDCQSNEDIADFWAIRLDQGDLDRCEQTAFENWQAENSGNVRLLMRARQTWRSMEMAVTDSPRVAQENTERQPVDLDGIRADLERLGALEGRQGRLPGMQSGKRRFRPKLAAAIGLVLGGLFVLGGLRRDPDLIAANDASAVREIHELTDGSRVWMEPGTRLAVKYDDTGRDITVLEGGIYIEVAPDKSRPLRVRLNDITAQAVGTAFVASKWGGLARVEVSEGLVDLRQSDGNIRLAKLSAGRAAWQLPTGDMRYGTRDVDRIAGWRNGRWMVNEMSLEELIARISPLLPGQNFILDPRMGDIFVTGNFDLAKPDSAMNALMAAYDLENKAYPGGFHLISKK